jgi:hypothetical protein
MSKIVGLIVLVTFLSPSAMARDPYPKGEFFGGYSLFLADTGHAALGFNGFDMSITENVNHWFGGALDVSTHWKSGVNVTTYMYGPVFSYRKNPRITPFVRVLGGGVRGSEGYLNISHSSTSLGMTAGGGFDAKISKDLAVRVIQVDYVLSSFSGSTQSNIRASVGLVYRFSFGAR